MSWLTEIAGKAENFLNAVDKGAANALTNVNKNVRKHSFKSDANSEHQNSYLDTEYVDTPEIMSLRTSPSTNSLFSENGNGKKGHTRTSSYDSNGSRSSNSKTLDDDRLMEYLNNKDNDIPEEEWQGLNDTNNKHPSNQPSDKSKTKREALTHVRELDSLNKRILELNSEYKKQKLKAQNYYNQNSVNEKLVRELRSKEGDLMASISAKDSQIAALKVQNEQMLIEIQEKEDKYKELENLNLQLNQTVNNKSQDNAVIHNLEQEIESLKQSLKFEKEEAKRIQENNNQQILRLEDNQRSLIEELENCRRQLNDAKSDCAELELTNNSLQKKFEALDEEFSQFKLKANKTLKDKDELIQKLSATTKQENQLQSKNNQDEYAQMLHEQCNTLVNELTELRTKYDLIKSSLEEAENEKIPRQNYEIKTLKEELEQERKSNKNLKQEISQLSIDCKSYQDDLNQIKMNLSARITERDEEIDKLRKQLVLKQRGTMVSSSANDCSNVNASTEEWEQRLKSLTENLIAKQSSIEQLSSANHSLRLQLERSEQKLRECASNGGNLNNDVAIGIYHSPTFTNLIKHRMTGSNINDSVPLIHDDPNDGQVTRKVKRAYTAIDTFSIRLGNFLRMYPSARAAFLIYILILHVWVAFILMYYEPEIHGPNLE